MTTEKSVVSVELCLDPAQHADAHELEDATLSLMRDLQDSDLAESVSRPTAAAPSGAKAGEVLTAGAVILAVLPVAVEQILGMLRNWVARPGNPPVRFKVSRGDRSMEGEFDPATLSIQDMQSFLANVNLMLKE
jgi:hypothetical protein